MRRRVVVYAPEAQADLLHLYDTIAAIAGEAVALGFIERIDRYCRGFDHASERGQKRDDIRQGLRVIGFERRVTVAFAVDDGHVTILRFFYGGQDWERRL